MALELVVEAQPDTLIIKAVVTLKYSKSIVLVGIASARVSRWLAHPCRTMTVCTFTQTGRSISVTTARDCSRLDKHNESKKCNCVVDQ